MCLLGRLIDAGSAALLKCIVERILTSANACCADRRVTYFAFFASLRAFASDRGPSREIAHCLAVATDASIGKFRLDSQINEHRRHLLQLFGKGAALQVIEAAMDAMRAVVPADKLIRTTAAVIDALRLPAELHIVRWAFEKHNKQFTRSELQMSLERVARKGYLAFVEYFFFLLKAYVDQDAAAAAPPTADDIDSDCHYDAAQRRSILHHALILLFSSIRDTVLQVEDIARNTAAMRKREAVMKRIFKEAVAAGVDMSEAVEESGMSSRTVVAEAVFRLLSDDADSVWRLLRWLVQQPQINLLFTADPTLGNDFFQDLLIREYVGDDEVHRKSRIADLVDLLGRIFAFLIEHGADMKPAIDAIEYLSLRRT